MQHVENVLASDHQTVDIVAFVTHNLQDEHAAKDDIVVEAPEVCHELTVIDIGQGDANAHQYNDARREGKANAGILVAHDALHFQFQILSDFAKTVQIAECGDMGEVGRGGVEEFFHHKEMLHTTVNSHQDCQQ